MNTCLNPYKAQKMICDFLKKEYGMDGDEFGENDEYFIEENSLSWIYPSSAGSLEKVVYEVKNDIVTKELGWYHKSVMPSASDEEKEWQECEG